MGTAPPNVFGPFRVLHQVGAGTLGPVFRAYDPDRDRLVAIKLFRLDLAPDRVHRLVAALETILAAGLAHPAIVQPIAAGIDGVDAYLAQEYVTAESLDIVVREHGPVPLRDAVRISAQLAGALDVAAAAGIVHGALHPRDLILSLDEPRLTGLGVAGALEAIGLVAPIRRPYAAPERAAGEAWHRSSDLFSLAALMHELLWGRRIAATGREVADSLTEISGGSLSDLQTVFACALAENPDDRFATASEFAEALKNCLGHPAAATSHQPLATSPMDELRLPLEDEVVGHAVFQAPPPSLDMFVERYTDVDLTAGPVSSRQLAVGSQESAVGSRQSESPVGSRQSESPVGGQESPVESLHSLDADDQPPAAGPQPPVASAQRRPPLWPVGVALLAGAVIGAVGGYGVGRRVLPSLPASSSVSLSNTVRLPSTSLGPGKPDTTKSTPKGALPIASPSAATRAAGDVTLTPDITKKVTPPAPPTPPDGSETGRLVVRSLPAGAQVFLDGKDIGRTPVTVRDLARGSHRVRLTRDGYATTERRVSISSDQLSRSMLVRLERPSARNSTPRTSNPAPGTRNAEPGTRN